MRWIISLLLLLFTASCHNSSEPDISKVKVALSTQRFEKELFSLDTNRLPEKLDELIRKYPSFGENFITTILNTDPSWSADSASKYVAGFIAAYRKVYDSAQKVFADFEPYESDIKKAIQYLKYYYPSYKVPSKLITYIGPLDGFGDILSEDAFIVGLHHHLGKNFSLYQSDYVNETYPRYISNRFEPGYISINCMKNVINDMYPEKYEEKSLIIQMVESGKRLYLLSKLVPQKEEYMLIGYTPKQLKECYENEKMIWDLFVQNNLLQTTDNNIITNYIGEAPKTKELGEASPGNIGSFAGWQVVKAYMKKNPEKTPDVLMKEDAEMIFEKAKYKP